MGYIVRLKRKDERDLGKMCYLKYRDLGGIDGDGYCKTVKKRATLFENEEEIKTAQIMDYINRHDFLYEIEQVDDDNEYRL